MYFNVCCYQNLFFGLLLHVLDDDQVPCRQPEKISQGMYNWDRRSNVARFACYQGYHLVGPAQLECRYGNWHPSTYPTCKPVVCNQPTISHGRLETGDSVRYRSGQKAVIVCDEGFEIRSPGGSKLECQEDGSWQSPMGSQFPICKGSLR